MRCAMTLCFGERWSRPLSRLPREGSVDPLIPQYVLLEPQAVHPRAQGVEWYSKVRFFIDYTHVPSYRTGLDRSWRGRKKYLQWYAVMSSKGEARGSESGRVEQGKASWSKMTVCVKERKEKF